MKAENGGPAPAKPKAKKQKDERNNGISETVEGVEIVCRNKMYQGKKLNGATD